MKELGKLLVAAVAAAALFATAVPVSAAPPKDIRKEFVNMQDWQIGGSVRKGVRWIEGGHDRPRFPVLLKLKKSFKRALLDSRTDPALK